MTIENYPRHKFLLLNQLGKDTIDALRMSSAIIAGGAIRSVFGKEFISDYDLYFFYQGDLDRAKEYFDDKFVLKYSTPNAYSYSKDKIRVQLIRSPHFVDRGIAALLDEFDFTVCMGAFYFSDEMFCLSDRFLLDLSRKELKFNVNAKYPLSSLFRVRKYLSKGYTISGTDIIKIGLSINNLDMKTYSDLKDQLLGIDTAFLQELTDKLMSPEYAEKRYDFNEFMDMINMYYLEQLDLIMG